MNHRHHEKPGVMAIKGCEWAQFVVWTEAANDNLFVEEISFDKLAWDIDIFLSCSHFMIWTNQ